MAQTHLQEQNKRKAAGGAATKTKKKKSAKLKAKEAAAKLAERRRVGNLRKKTERLVAKRKRNDEETAQAAGAGETMGAGEEAAGALVQVALGRAMTEAQDHVSSARQAIIAVETWREVEKEYYANDQTKIRIKVLDKKIALEWSQHRGDTKNSRSGFIGAEYFRKRAEAGATTVYRNTRSAVFVTITSGRRGKRQTGLHPHSGARARRVARRTVVP